MPKAGNNFYKNIFINCPFDPEYKQLLKAIVFTVIYLKFEPRIATERNDAAEVRINKIKELIKESCYSIHDISRMEPLKSKDLPRFNMPFELGLDLGCREYGSGKLRNKKFLVLEKDRFRFQKVISDISGSDISPHKNEPQILIKQIREWILNIVNKRIPNSTEVWQSFNAFIDHFEKTCKKLNYKKKEINDMQISEYKIFIEEWIEQRSKL